MSPVSNIVQVPLTTQLLALSMGLQVVAFIAVLWRGIFGLPQLATRRPRWPFIPLVAGAACGLWYAWIRLDLLMAVAQALALFIGYMLIMSTRGERTAPAPAGTTRRERREAERQAKKQARRGGTGNGQ
jgi:hypothetical protein